jgi:pyruvate/2-oxoglutarate dehydrogenase complex dihydrolipoamide dehydrogenase (E3) component
MAGILRSLGSNVSLLIRKDKVLRNFDEMISTAVTEELGHIGVQVVPNSNVSFAYLARIKYRTEGIKIKNFMNTLVK